MEKLSEVTELTDEHAREMLRKYSAALQAYAVADAGSEAERIADEESDRLEAELLRRLSFQGAGPTCPKCQKGTSLVLRDYSDGVRLACGNNCGLNISAPHGLEFSLSDFAQFFRAPSDTGRAELCGEVVQHLIAGASWFTCAMLKGHEGGHRAAGNCIKHGAYMGEPYAVPQCPKWPDCIKGAVLTASDTGRDSNIMHRAFDFQLPHEAVKPIGDTGREQPTMESDECEHGELFHNCDICSLAPSERVAPEQAQLEPSPFNPANLEANAALAATMWSGFCKKEGVQEGRAVLDWWGFKWAAYAMAALEALPRDSDPQTEKNR